MTGRRQAFWLTLAAGLVIGAPAFAQGTPDAGAFQNQNEQAQEDLEQENDPRPGEEASITGPEREGALEVPPGGPTFVLTSVTFSPSAFLSEAELAAIAAPYVGRPVDFSQIQALINAVNARYSEMGIVTASASLPPQDIEGGVLQVELIEGKVGAVSMEGVARSNDYLSRRIRLEPGEVVDVRRLGGTVSTQNRIGDAKVRTILQPGTEFGQTDVTLSVTEPARNSLDIFADNHGSRTVGRYQLGALFQHYGLLGIDDRIKLYGVWAEGNVAGNASYTFGIAPTGARVGLSYSRSQIRIIDGAFSVLNVTGSSQGGGINLAQPVFASGPWLGIVNVGGTVTNSITLQGGIAVTDNLTWKGSAGVTLNYYGERLAFSVSPYYARSHTDLRTVGTTQDVHFFAGSASLTALLPGDLVLQGSGSWQVASQLLVTGDQLFQIGGPSTIRGYDPDAAAGGSGYYASLELHRGVDAIEGLDLFTFVDFGQVFSTSPARTSLAGAGAGFSYTFRERATLEVSLAGPIGQRLPGQPDFTVFGRFIVKAF
jgi:hemolysin activation/secretion protein